MDPLTPCFAAMADYCQFIVYRATPDGVKIKKVPIDPNTGLVHDAHDPAIWTTPDVALDAARRLGPGHGLAFVLTESDPFFLLDIDDAYHSGWSEISQSLCAQFAGAAVEVSMSGRGLHIVGSLASVPEHAHKFAAANLELYTARRMISMTGTHARGDARHDCTAAFAALVEQYFKPAPPPVFKPSDASTAAGLADDDDQLIARARRTQSASSAFAGRASFAALWDCDVDALAASYPDPTSARAYDESSADAALASHLAFWTGCDAARMLSLMRQSGLAREKWDTHKTYLNITIDSAIKNCKTVYTGPQKKEQSPAAPEPRAREIKMLTGYQFLSGTAQPEHFRGCVYVQDMHRVFTPAGSFLKPDQFKATYGGYVFALDATNDKTTKNAWEAFTESQCVRYPIAESASFRPDKPSGELFEDEGRQLLNTYLPLRIKRTPGDVTRVLDHLHTVLPNHRDAEILLSYMAACVQHQGVKFQWWPLIQGIDGNGKTLFSRYVAHAVGLRYSHFPRADEVGKKFNAWILNKIFIGVEDVYCADQKTDIMESLKPLITNEWQPIELKGVDPINARVCANGILNSNHRGALRKHSNDRRLCVFYTAQQSAEDIVAAGMGGDYFVKHYQWLNNGGYAVVSDFLATYKIAEEFNPAGACQRPPETSTTAAAIEYCLGGLEQEINEAIDEGRPGFCGGWVSSMACDRLIESLRLTRAIPPNRRREILQSLGYDWHPALKNGRVNNAIGIDGGKPKLFIKKGHVHLNLQSPAAVASAYVEAQRGSDTLTPVFFSQKS